MYRRCQMVTSRKTVKLLYCFEEIRRQSVSKPILLKEYFIPYCYFVNFNRPGNRKVSSDLI